MRLTGVMLLAFCLQVSARSGAQERIAINVKHFSLQKLFVEIEKKTNYIFFYDVATLNETKPVTMAVKAATVEEVLRKALFGQALEYTITDKSIFVKKENNSMPEVAATSTICDRTIKIREVVLTDASVPVQSMTVTIKQTENGTITNAKGELKPSNGSASTVTVQVEVADRPKSSDAPIEFFIICVAISIGTIFCLVQVYIGPLDAIFARREALRRMFRLVETMVTILELGIFLHHLLRAF